MVTIKCTKVLAQESRSAVGSSFPPKRAVRAVSLAIRNTIICSSVYKY
jgi:hypothetical protein